MKPVAVLNEFQKKSILNNLSDFGVFNMAFYVDGFGEGHYVFFYEKNDMPFTSSFHFCGNAYANVMPDIQDFCNNVREVLEEEIKNLEVNIFSNHPVDLDNYVKFATYVSGFVTTQLFDYSNCGLVNYEKSYMDSGLIENQCFSLISNGKNRIDILREYLYEINILRDGMYSDIMSVCDREFVSLC